MLWLDGGAEERARNKAKRDVQDALEFGVDAVPCPSCGWYQADMVPKVRWRHGKRWAYAGAILMLLSVICVTILSVITWNPHLRQRPPWLDTLIWSVLLSLGGAGLALVVIYVVRCFRFDPNAGDQEQRMRIGRQRAFTKDEAVARKLLSPFSPGTFSCGGERFKLLRAWFTWNEGVLSIHAEGNQCGIDLPHVAFRLTTRLADLSGRRRKEQARAALFHVFARDLRFKTDTVYLHFEDYDADKSILSLSFEFDDSADPDASGGESIHGKLRCQETRAESAGGFSWHDEWFNVSQARFIWKQGVFSLHAKGDECDIDFSNIVFRPTTHLSDLPGQSRKEQRAKNPFQLSAGERRFKRDTIYLDFEDYDAHESIISLTFFFGNAEQEPIRGHLRCREIRDDRKPAPRTEVKK
ncbi:MAG: hypothetical protein U0793_28330 [Gemmataceae bacterium]